MDKANYILLSFVHTYDTYKCKNYLHIYMYTSYIRSYRSM